MNLTTYTKTGNLSKRPVIVDDSIFAAPVNEQLLAQAIRVYLSNQRQGTSKVQTRSEVTRTKKKWYRQKGTGNARHGSRNANLFVGGGVSHGPTGKESWNRKMGQRLKHQALISALSAQQDNIVVADAFNELSGKTKEAVELLQTIAQPEERVLIVFDVFDKTVVRSLRNIENVILTQAQRLNVYETALANKIIMTSDAIKMLEERLSKKQGKSADKK